MNGSYYTTKQHTRPPINFFSHNITHISGEQFTQSLLIKALLPNNNSLPFLKDTSEPFRSNCHLKRNVGLLKNPNNTR